MPTEGNMQIAGRRFSKQEQDDAWRTREEMSIKSADLAVARNKLASLEDPNNTEGREAETKESVFLKDAQAEDDLRTVENEARAEDLERTKAKDIAKLRERIASLEEGIRGIK